MGKDSEGNRESDSGCQVATEYRGRQSHCLQLDGYDQVIDKCPFNKCALDMSRAEINQVKYYSRNVDIRQQFGQGMTQEAVASAFGVSKRTVARLVRRN